MTTALTYLGGAGAYFLKCEVDSNGVVHASLWQSAGPGQDFNVSEDKSYEGLKQYYKEIGTQYEGSDDFRTKLTQDIRRRTMVNYMVIAIRSSEKS